MRHDPCAKCRSAPFEATERLSDGIRRQSQAYFQMQGAYPIFARGWVILHRSSQAKTAEMTPRPKLAWNP